MYCTYDVTLSHVCVSSGKAISITYSECVFVMLVMLTVCWQTFNITSMTNTCYCIYSVETPNDGQ